MGTKLPGSPFFPGGPGSPTPLGVQRVLKNRPFKIDMLTIRSFLFEAGFLPGSPGGPLRPGGPCLPSPVQQHC